MQVDSIVSLQKELQICLGMHEQDWQSLCGHAFASFRSLSTCCQEFDLSDSAGKRILVFKGS